MPRSHQEYIQDLKSQLALGKLTQIILEEGLFQDQWVLQYPNAGIFASGVGMNLFDFRTAQITLYDSSTDQLTSKLGDYNTDCCRSLFFWCDVEANVRLYYKGRSTELIDYNPSLVYSGVHLPFDRLAVINGTPADFSFVASTSIQPWNISAVDVSQFRWTASTAGGLGNTGSTTNKEGRVIATGGKTGDTFAALNWQAVDRAGNLSSASAPFTDSVLHCDHLHNKTVEIFNTDSANSLDVQIQAQGSANSTLWATDSSTISGVNQFITITKGNNAIFQVDVYYHRLKVNLRSTSAGNPASWEAHFQGVSN